MMNKIYYWILSLIPSLHFPFYSPGQDFYFGADLSYVNEMEDCGAIYKVQNTPVDPFRIFADNGANLVRARLWHTPSWYDELNMGQRYGDFADVKNTIARAKAEGMDVLLDFHLSDNWADPGNQLAPEAWWPVLDSLSILQDSLYQYIHSTLASLAEENLLPEIIQIGNETNKGILLSEEENQSWILDWPRNAALFNTAIDAIRDIEMQYEKEIRIALHIADPSDVDWLAEQLWENGVRDFDIIGISYYYQYHDNLIAYVGGTIGMLKNLYPEKEVMILETAYPWTTQNADSAPNLLNGNYPGYTVSPAGQKDFLIALAHEVIDKGGLGIVYWEPAWVSTGCHTQWAIGSHWDNATFFDASHELIEDGGIGWMTYPYEGVAVEPGPSADNILDIRQDGNEVWIYNGRFAENRNNLSVQVYSIDGQRVFHEDIMVHWNDNRYLLELLELIPGLFVIKIIGDGFGVAKKIIIIR